MDADRFYIGGEWVAPIGTATMPIMDPATEARIGTVALGGAADVERAVQAAVAAFESFGRWPKAERLALLRRIRDLTAERREDLAQAMRREMGAPITMARDVQAEAGIGHADGFIEALEAQEERWTLSNGDTLLREPIGPVGLITPWNWPINQIALKVLPALATGCPAILKPSEHTPLSAMVYAGILHDAGVPPGAFALIHGTGPEVGDALARHPALAMVSFTGSTRAGISVSKSAADSVKRVTLELGGKSPNLVFADCGADLETRARASVVECFLNTGQSCDAPTRMIVERACYDDVVEIARIAAEETKVGDPAREGDHIGPLFDRLQWDRVQARIAEGIAEGARLVAGGPGRPDGLGTGWYARPTVFADVSNDMTIAREEIFGPVLSILPAADESEAIAIANDTPYGLAAYMQTGDLERAERVAGRLRAGAVHINGGGLGWGTPFGGYKASGNGREGGAMGLEDYQEVKSLHFG
ncbi:aldehyde dehydrogenase family protein [Roseibacterium sp. SDUM158016]|uniref:aldehyde dehydrogenase family protein n=1 Tax=Roseicyclus sediminis TaxID=2980997 RepID=UPI0021D01BB8|nr:aldehyde dehydrogenase family protein [Roseibacterium sp. SDUM158016]MCU4651642.1 aldehyde dehydrogenase family protein [Roseibacterium sp. SDUM158016]